MKDFNETTHVDPATMPYDSGISILWHRHTCPECGFVWAHDGSERRSRTEYEDAHHCLQCGAEQKWCTPVERKKKGRRKSEPLTEW